MSKHKRVATPVHQEPAPESNNNATWSISGFFKSAGSMGSKAGTYATKALLGEKSDTQRWFEAKLKKPARTFAAREDVFRCIYLDSFDAQYPRKAPIHTTAPVPTKLFQMIPVDHVFTDIKVGILAEKYSHNDIYTYLLQYRAFHEDMNSSDANVREIASKNYDNFLTAFGEESTKSFDTLSEKLDRLIRNKWHKIERPKRPDMSTEEIDERIGTWDKLGDYIAKVATSSSEAFKDAYPRIQEEIKATPLLEKLIQNIDTVLTDIKSSITTHNVPDNYTLKTVKELVKVIKKKAKIDLPLVAWKQFHEAQNALILVALMLPQSQDPDVLSLFDKCLPWGKMNPTIETSIMKKHLPNRLNPVAAIAIPIDDSNRPIPSAPYFSDLPPEPSAPPHPPEKTYIHASPTQTTVVPAQAKSEDEKWFDRQRDKAKSDRPSELLFQTTLAKYADERELIHESHTLADLDDVRHGIAEYIATLLPTISITGTRGQFLPESESCLDKTIAILGKDTKIEALFDTLLTSLNSIAETATPSRDLNKVTMPYFQVIVKTIKNTVATIDLPVVTTPPLDSDLDNALILAALVIIRFRNTDPRILKLLDQRLPWDRMQPSIKNVIAERHFPHRRAITATVAAYAAAPDADITPNHRSETTDSCKTSMGIPSSELPVSEINTPHQKAQDISHTQAVAYEAGDEAEPLLDFSDTDSTPVLPRTRTYPDWLNEFLTPSLPAIKTVQTDQPTTVAIDINRPEKARPS